MLVGVLCIRFRIGQPKLVAEFITRAMEKMDKGSNVAGSVGRHITMLWNWMSSMLDQVKKNERLPVMDKC